MTVDNFWAAFDISSLCAWDLLSRLFRLQPVRTTLLILFELLRGLLPATRGFFQALILNEVRYHSFDQSRFHV